MRRQAVTEDETGMLPGEREVGMLLRALQATDPSWKLSSVEDDLQFFSVRRKTWALSQGTRTFCRGYDLPGLLQDFVEASRDRGYVSVNGFRLPGALMSTVDVDDLATRLKLLF